MQNTLLAMVDQTATIDSFLHSWDVYQDEVTHSHLAQGMTKHCCRTTLWHLVYEVGPKLMGSILDIYSSNHFKMRFFTSNRIVW